MKKYKNHVMFGVGLIVTAVMLYLSTRNVSLQGFIGEMKNFHPIWLIPALLTFYYSMYLRAVRWGLFFRPHHDLKGYQVFRPLMVCFGFNCLFPARVGEVVRAWLVGTRNKTGVPTALATVVVERVIDAITLVGMLAFSLLVLPPMDPAMKVEVWGTSVSGDQFNHLKTKIVILSIVLVVGVIVFMLPLTQRLLHGSIKRLPASDGLKHKLRHLLDQFARGFHALQKPAVLAQIVFHSLALWVLVAFSNQMVAKGFGLNMSLTQAMALMVIVAIFITVPATPGYWGLFEAGTIFTVMIFGNTTRQSQALAFALTLHLVQYVPIVVLGMLFAWQMQVKRTDVAALEKKGD